jgi:hypothetical protein
MPNYAVVFPGTITRQGLIDYLQKEAKQLQDDLKVLKRAMEVSSEGELDDVYWQKLGEINGLRKASIYAQENWSRECVVCHEGVKPLETMQSARVQAFKVIAPLCPECFNDIENVPPSALELEEKD